MARDHRKLRVFQDAHQLALAIYKHTRNFSRDEWFGLRLQMRRASVSIPSNIVEGNARRTTKDYCNSVNIARGSAAELLYPIDLSSELELLDGPAFEGLNDHCERVVKQLQKLIQTMEGLLLKEQKE